MSDRSRRSLLIGVVLAAATDLAEAQSTAGGQAPGFSCADVLGKAEARVAAALRTLEELPACPSASAGSAGTEASSEELRSELREATAEVARLREQVETVGGENGRLRAQLDDLRAGRLASLRAAILSFIPADGNCETLVVEAEGTEGLIISGRVRDPVALRGQVDGLTESASGISINYAGLSQLDVCGVRIGDEFIAEAGEDGEQSAVRRDEIGDDRGGRVPRADDCPTVGAALAARRTEDGADWIEAFWVLREGADPAQPNYVLCRHGRNTDRWLVYEANLTGQSGLMIVRSGK